MIRSILASAALACGLAAPVSAAPVQWTSASGGNDHWYEVIWLRIGEISWSYAKAAAEARTHLGQSGYLATITSGAEQSFLNSLNAAYTASSPYHSGTYVRAWLGGHDSTTEGTWEWVTGEAFSYTNWAGGEPNDYRGEDALVGWWSGSKWNDCDNYCGIHKFVVEFDNLPSEVPLPASLPLAAAGFGVLGWLGRRRKKA